MHLGVDAFRISAPPLHLRQVAWPPSHASGRQALLLVENAYLTRVLPPLWSSGKSRSTAYMYGAARLP
ncbi:hypothetical protein ECG_03790 [Echinococcus granulosus]|nr:hypothetical protein ECG_03790 [Echinococcus granulosus]